MAEKQIRDPNTNAKALGLIPIDTSVYENFAKQFEDLAVKQREQHSKLVELNHQLQQHTLVQFDATSFVLGVSVCAVIVYVFSRW